MADDNTLPTGEIPDGDAKPLLEIGQLVGDRYQIRALLGRGGMGEVWHAFDVKLRIDVALKSLRAEHHESEKRRELLRSEVRAARGVVSPNVCRVFDLEVEGALELVSMEYIDGITLTQLLKERGPLSLREAGELAAQFLAGLESIHEAGLVHRDIKPENLMITRAGRVVVMDFGIAKHADSEETAASGTPAYMAPEQAEGIPIDGRADIFSAGIVLAEMIAAEGIRERSTRETLWRGIREDPPQLPESPWQPVLRKAIARDPADRYPSAQALVRALEKITLRSEGGDQTQPYPGLASFQERQAEHFFGREAEVEALLRKLEHPHLMAVVGPSGAGKSSFLQAGVVPALPEDWRHALAHPGSDPFAALRRALEPELADAGNVPDLSGGAAADAAVAMLRSRRRARGRLLLIVDQFEELFTQNTAETQARFSDLLGRLVLEADVHVLLSMRDDFLLHCQEQPALRSIFSELTPLRAPTGTALRRALVQPALACGYRFEDESLVDEMIAEVAGERGALPLLAFAAASLWERRDRDSGEMTRTAYEEIGGVGGALARHAESTLERIGLSHELTVREILRNLVTVQGTRATRERAELLSVFDEPDQPGRVLDALIDARLLTSFDVAGAQQAAPSRRIEVVHESLLAAWPRLVRWQAQDAEGALLRDQLRQAAQLWEQRDRPDDLLWTGTAVEEYRLWRERYPGGLTASEAAFAGAMLAGREARARRRRLLAASVLTTAILVAVVTGTLWRRSDVARNLAEAQKLLALAEVEMDRYPTGALAYATRSLSLSDSPEARLLALRALWRGPPAFMANEDGSWGALFDPEGRTLLQVRRVEPGESHLRLLFADGTSQLMERMHEARIVRAAWLGKTGPPDVFASWSGGEGGRVVYWSASERRPFAEKSDQSLQTDLEHGSRSVVHVTEDGRVVRDPLGAGEPRELGQIRFSRVPGAGALVQLSEDARSIVGLRDGEVLFWRVEPGGLSRASALGRHVGATGVVLAPDGRRVATRDDSGEIRLWSSTGARGFDRISGPGGPIGSPWGSLEFSIDGSLLQANVWSHGEPARVWTWSVAGERPRLLRRFQASETQGHRALDAVRLQTAGGRADGSVAWQRLAAPDGAEPTILRTRGQQVEFPEFDPTGRWLATPHEAGLELWPLTQRHPFVIESEGCLAFDPRGRWLASASGSGEIRKWPLEGEVPSESHILREDAGQAFLRLAVSPDGSRLAVTTEASGEGAFVATSEDGTKRILPEGFRGQTRGVAFSPDGKLLAIAGGQFDETQNQIRVWDAASLELLTVIDPDEVHYWGNLAFSGNDHILWSSPSGLDRFDVKTGRVERIHEGGVGSFAATADGRRIFMATTDPEQWPIGSGAALLEVGAARSTPLPYGERIYRVALDPEGRIAVASNLDGEVRVGLVTGELPHLLLGHSGSVDDVAIDPLGRWIASSGGGEIRLWPLPDLSRPPVQTLPIADLLATLESLTNLRVVPDPDASTGWGESLAPFAGWEATPSW